MYHYDVDTFRIPDQASLSELTKRVNMFIEEKEDVLHIFYYGGQGAINPERHHPIWAA
jgi:hypothetical protein